MIKTHLKIKNNKDLFLCSTEVENLFINEFLPAAPGDYVKVYLFGLMYASYGIEIGIEDMSKILGISQKDIINAWEYWTKAGIVESVQGETDKDVEIEFVSQIGRLYGSGKPAAHENKEQPAEETKTAENREAVNDDRLNQVMDMELRELYGQYEYASGRAISQREMRKLSDAIKVYNITPDVLGYSIKYCSELEKNSIDYICKVALRWTEEGCRNIGQVKEYLDRHSRKNEIHGMIFRELGFTRLPSPADREIMDRWIDEMEFSVKEVLDACRAAAGLREPNLRYVNKVLENRMLEKGGINTKADASGEGKPAVSNKVLKEYYEFIRRDESSRRDARIDEICEKLPEMRILFEQENDLNEELLSGNMMRAGAAARETLKKKRHRIEEDKRRILAENGYGEDYLDRKYRCGICRDTGFTKDGRVCVCSETRAEEAYKWNQKTTENKTE